jgi:hypothetical protein
MPEQGRRLAEGALVSIARNRPMSPRERVTSTPLCDPQAGSRRTCFGVQWIRLAARSRAIPTALDRPLGYRARVTQATREERLLASALYASVYSICVLTLPLAAYLMSADRSYVRKHARRALILQLAILVGPAVGAAVDLTGGHPLGTLIAFVTYGAGLAVMAVLSVGALTGRL